MRQDIIQGIGLGATLLGVVDFIPQIHLNYRNKSAEGLSMDLITIGIVSTVLWWIYGDATDDQLLVASSVITIVAYLILLVQMFMYHPMYRKKT